MRKRHVKFESLGGLVNYGSISGGGSQMVRGMMAQKRFSVTNSLNIKWY